MKDIPVTMSVFHLRKYSGQKVQDFIFTTEAEFLTILRNLNFLLSSSLQCNNIHMNLNWSR